MTGSLETSRLVFDEMPRHHSLVKWTNKIITEATGLAQVGKLN